MNINKLIESEKPADEIVTELSGHNYDSRSQDVLYRSAQEFVAALVNKAIEPEYYDAEYNNAAKMYGERNIRNIIGSVTGGINISNAGNYADYYRSSKNLNFDPRR